MPRKPPTKGKVSAPRKPAGKRRSGKPKLDWTIQMRVKPNHVELVEVPLNKDDGEERVIRVIRGRVPPKPAKGRRLGLISDVSGQTALKAFRIAVREAKAR